MELPVSTTNSSSNHQPIIEYDEWDDEDDDIVPTLVPIQKIDSEITKEISSTTSLSANNITTGGKDEDASFHSTNDNDINNTDVYNNKCPVTILTGFLGSGKSTLVQYILTSPDHGRRIAVIENEYGRGGNSNGSGSGSSTSIESMIVRDGIKKSQLDDTEKPEFIDLPNGCVCCTVKDSLVITLEQLLLRREQKHNNNANPIDYIIIECSGMANPGPIASIFWLDDALQSRLVLDGIITMVDITNIEQQFIDAPTEVTQQIAYADRILLNKIDRIRGNDKNASIVRVMNRIHQIHPTVSIRTTSFAAVPDIDWILNAQCFNLELRYPIIPSQSLSSMKTTTTTTTTLSNPNSYFDDMATCNPCNNDDNNDNNNNNNNSSTNDIMNTATTGGTIVDHTHTVAVTTITISVRGMVDVQKVHLFLASILWPNQDGSEHVLRTRMETEQQQQQNEQSHNNTEMIDDVSTTLTKKDISTETRQQQQIFRIKGILSVGFVRSINDDDNDDTAFLTRSIVQPRIELNKEGANGSVNNNNDDSNTIILYSDVRRYIVQGVYDLWDIHPCTNPELFWNVQDTATTSTGVVDEVDTSCRISQLIIIGRHLQKQMLQTNFDNCKL